MKKNDPNARYEGRETAINAEDGPGREDTNRTDSDPLAKFAKDKRKRITRVEKNPGKFDSSGESLPGRSPREERRYGDSPNRGPRPSGHSGERRSYNPNFTHDNKLRSGSRESGGYNRDDRGYSDKPRDNYNRNDYNSTGREERNGRSGSAYDHKPGYGNSSRGYGNNDRSAGYGSRESSDNRNNRPSGYGNRPSPQGNRPGGYDSNRYGGSSRPGGGRPQGGYDSRTGKGRPGGPGRGKPAFDKENYPKYPRGRQADEMRLNRYLSISGICSRREADDLIAAGLVTVNGTVVTEMGSKVMPGDVVRYDGSVVRGESKVYIVMNKPKGFVTSLDDPHAEKTVMDLLRNSVKERVYPVGRLDKNSMGVLLITNDGDMTKKLTHPAYEKKKIYQVSIDKVLSPDDKAKIEAGIMLEDGFIRVDSIDYINDDLKDIGIEIHSGRNRVVRRIFEHLGYQMRKLDRVYFAGLTKKNLKRGAWRFLTPREVSALHSGQYE